jgi:hypothetical protein
VDRGKLRIKMCSSPVRKVNGDMAPPCCRIARARLAHAAHQLKKRTVGNFNFETLASFLGSAIALPRDAEVMTVRFGWPAFTAGRRPSCSPFRGIESKTRPLSP